MKMQSIAKALVYAGTLPFWFLLLVSLGLMPDSLLSALDVHHWAMAYSAVILSFITGIHWMLAIEPKHMTERQATWLLLNSNLVALWAWLMWGLQDEPLSWFGMVLGFIWLLWLEVRVVKLPSIWPWFWTLRWQASAVAVLSLSTTGLVQLSQALA